MKDLDNRQLKYFQKAITKWGKYNYSNFPWRKTQNKWHALVAEIMLQRTKAEQVLPAYQAFCKKYKSPSDYLKVKKPDVFSTLGLTWRENELKKLAEILAQNPIPENKSELQQLPGVGDYIASAYLSLHAGTRAHIIDSNVVRLYGRFFGFETDGETRRKKWFIGLAEKLTPQKRFREYNYGLIDFTREICRTKPPCDTCILRKRCEYYH